MKINNKQSTVVLWTILGAIVTTFAAHEASAQRWEYHDPKIHKPGETTRIGSFGARSSERKIVVKATEVPQATNAPVPNTVVSAPVPNTVVNVPVTNNDHRSFVVNFNTSVNLTVNNNNTEVADGAKTATVEENKPTKTEPAKKRATKSDKKKAKKSTGNDKQHVATPVAENVQPVVEETQAQTTQETTVVPETTVQTPVVVPAPVVNNEQEIEHADEIKTPATPAPTEKVAAPATDDQPAMVAPAEEKEVVTPVVVPVPTESKVEEVTAPVIVTPQTPAQEKSDATIKETEEKSNQDDSDKLKDDTKEKIRQELIGKIYASVSEKVKAPVIPNPANQVSASDFGPEPQIPPEAWEELAVMAAQPEQPVVVNVGTTDVVVTVPAVATEEKVAEVTPVIVTEEKVAEQAPAAEVTEEQGFWSKLWPFGKKEVKTEVSTTAVDPVEPKVEPVAVNTEVVVVPVPQAEAPAVNVPVVAVEEKAPAVEQNKEEATAAPVQVTEETAKEKVEEPKGIWRFFRWIQKTFFTPASKHPGYVKKHVHTGGVSGKSGGKSSGGNSGHSGHSGHSVGGGSNSNGGRGGCGHSGPGGGSNGNGGHGGRSDVKPVIPAHLQNQQIARVVAPHVRAEQSRIMLKNDRRSRFRA